MSIRQSGNRIHHLQQRKRSPALAYSIALLSSLMMTVMIGFSLARTSDLGPDAEADRRGAVVVSSRTTDRIRELERIQTSLSYVRSQRATPTAPPGLTEQALAADLAEHQGHLQYRLEVESDRLARTRGGHSVAWQQRLKAVVASEKPQLLVPESESAAAASATSWRILSVGVLIWWLALALQGDGFAIDMNRRRHPLWEWYLAFPVPQPAIYLAEALKPIVSNPFLLSSPLMLMVLAALVNKSLAAGLAAFAVALPFTASAAVMTKAIEVQVMLRASPRNRSAWLVAAGGIGFVLLMTPLIALTTPSLSWGLARWLAGAGDTATPSAELFLHYPDVIAWLRAIVLSLLLNGVLCALALVAMHAATLRGFEAGFGGAEERVDPSAIGALAVKASRWRRSPLLRKELLWLRRDRGALVQMLLVPLLLVGLQAFYLGHYLRNIEFHWHHWAGIVLAAGAYMIAVSAPRMLAAEGPALGWMMSWPRSLLEVARTKAMVLTAFVSVMVLSSLVVVAWMHPTELWKIAVIGVLWLLSGTMIALKAVTVFPTYSATGEAMPMQASRGMAAAVGNMVIAIGVFGANWPLAIAGLLMNGVFAAALWSRLQVQLAYLFDPDAEPDEAPPTMLGALIAIVAHLELVAVLLALIGGVSGARASASALLIASAVSAALVSFYVWRWNRRFGVGLFDILVPSPMGRSTFAWLAGAAGVGVVLGALALAYLGLLHRFGSSELREQLASGAAFLRESNGALYAFAGATVVVAPLVEEYLFRGLLFRAMRREWPLWIAITLSAAFFAVMHPFASWPPVFLVGVASAWLFARAGNLLPSMLLHATYNAVVVLVPLTSGVHRTLGL
ncbi:MAG: CPBP family intramembrane metalloprotease [Xanthomonadales bacterium]|nr:CPBP family intramembrane metalloprotease [Xanthomonadales bacterium]